MHILFVQTLYYLIICLSSIVFKVLNLSCLSNILISNTVHLVSPKKNLSISLILVETVHLHYLCSLYCQTFSFTLLLLTFTPLLSNVSLHLSRLSHLLLPTQSQC